MTREEHLQWAKQRALAYVESGNIPDALASMFSDLRKHPETESHPAIQLGAVLMFSGRLSTPEEARKFIEDFN